MLIAGMEGRMQVIVKLSFHLPTLYSYRVPDASPGYAVSSPVASPLAIRLALVDAAIRTSGSVEEGRRIFELVKRASLWLVPPRRVCTVWAFLRRLKPSREDGGLVPSTGVRQYCHPEGPLEVYLKVPEREGYEDVIKYAPFIRRLGASDSLAYVTAELVGEVPVHLVAKPVSDLKLLPGPGEGLMPPIKLKDLPDDASFSDINPYGQMRRGFRYRDEFWQIPLKVIHRGGTWAVYERVGWA